MTVLVAEEGQRQDGHLRSLGTSVLIPDAYVPDLSVRLSLYRRIGALAENDDVSLISAELVDRLAGSAICQKPVLL